MSDSQSGIVLAESAIQSRIMTVRGVQVMLDRDLAELYGVTTKALNQAVKRNRERFPPGFMFVVPKDVVKELVTNCDRFGSMKHSSVAPNAFTEQGVSMLSAVLHSKTAIAVSIRIMEAFVAMRKFMLANAQVFQRIETVERKQLMTDAKVDRILERLDATEQPTQGVFYDGQLWDACSLVEKLIAKAKKTILLIDSWVDSGTLDMLAKKRKNVAVEIVASKRGNKLAATDITKFNAQYPAFAVRESAAFHDRFLILDDKEIYLIGASLKDLGKKKCFGFTKMDSGEIAGIKRRCPKAPERQNTFVTSPEAPERRGVEAGFEK